MREFGKVITEEFFEAAKIGGRKPWVEPTEILPVPTPEEMGNWYPDEAAENCRFRWEQNVATGERKAIELTLDEYRARHVAKIISRNEWLRRNREAKRVAKRQALVDAFIDTLETK